jgi:hypothetical protein
MSFASNGYFPETWVCEARPADCYSTGSWLASPGPLRWGVVKLDDDEFAEFEKCLSEPQKPTKAILEAAQLLRRLR